MSTTKAKLRRKIAPGAKRVWRTVGPRLPRACQRMVPASKRLLKRAGLVGPVMVDLPDHEPVTSLPEGLDSAEQTSIDWPNDAECPLCGTRTPSFLPDHRGRADVQCPCCGSLERHRLIWLYFGLRTDLFTTPIAMLHFAPEPHISTYLRRQENISYLSADLAIDAAMTEMDITAIDRPAASFDAIYASHVLEHVDDDRQAMTELRRVLRPGGWALLSVPMWGPVTREDPTVTDPDERARQFGQFDHVRMYGHDGQFEQRLRDAGFEVTVERFARALGPAATHRYRLPDRERLFICRPR